MGGDRGERHALHVELVQEFQFHAGERGERRRARSVVVDGVEGRIVAERDLEIDAMKEVLSKKW